MFTVRRSRFLWILAALLLILGISFEGVRRVRSGSNSWTPLPAAYTSMNITWPGRPNPERDQIAELGSRTVPALVRIIQRRDWREWRIWEQLRQRLPQSLGDLLPQSYVPVSERLKALWMLGELGPKASEATPALRQVARFGNATELQACARIALAHILPDDQGALSNVVAMLVSPQQTERFYAAHESGSFIDHPGFHPDLLLPALADTDGEVRANASFSIGQFGPRATNEVPALRSLLSDPYRHVSICAAYSLARIDPSTAAECTDAVVNALKRSADLSGIIAPSFFAAAGPKAIGALPYLENALTSGPGPLSSSSVAMALWHVTGKATPAMFTVLTRIDQATPETVSALGALGPAASNAIPRLRHLSQSAATPAVRRAATEALQAIEVAR
ncbi:MAG: hypothetical protein RIS76_1751 [Verrucomicrobiota bacterium]